MAEPTVSPRTARPGRGPRSAAVRRVLCPLVLGGVVVAGACSSGGAEAQQPTAAATRYADAAASGCPLVDGQAVSRVTALPFQAQPRPEGSDTCTFVEDGGGRVLTIDTAETSTGDALAALVSSYGLVELDTDVDDQTFASFGVDVGDGTVPTSTVLVRWGGSAALLQLTSPDPIETVQHQLVELARVIAPTLPVAPFDGEVTVAPASCADVDIAELGAALQLDPASLQVVALPGTTGCSITSSSSPVSATITIEPGEATVESLQGRGGSVSVDGTTYELVPQQVDVGSGGVWLADPVTGQSGELWAAVSGGLVRVTASGAPASELVDWAAAVAANAGPGLLR